MRTKWVDRNSGKRYSILPSGRGVARVMTYREYIATYESHPESKGIGPDGEPDDPRFQPPTVAITRAPAHP